MTSTPVDAEVQGMPATRTLTANDRCDVDGAQAYVVTAHMAGELLWCAHCFNIRAADLANFVVVDERQKLALAESARLT